MAASARDLLDSIMSACNRLQEVSDLEPVGFHLEEADAAMWEAVEATEGT